MEEHRGVEGLAERMRHVWPSRSEEEVLRALEEVLACSPSLRSGRVISMMYTPPHPLAVKAFTMFIEYNLDDRELYPLIAGLEDEAIAILSRILGSKHAKGYIVTGGTEANITGLWIARNRTSTPGRPEVLLPKTAHFSLIKAADMLCLKPVWVDLTENLIVDLADLESKITKNTVAMVGIAGSTEVGTIDPISEMSSIALERGIHLHVDAAFGGMIISVLRAAGYNLPSIGFENPGVSTITVDPHKLGLAPIPAGCILARGPELFEPIRVKTPYLLSGFHETLVGSRSGGSVAAVWAVLNLLGFDGYRRIYEELMRLKDYLVERLTEINGVELPVRPMLPIVSFRVSGLSASVLQAEMAKRGWHVYRAPLINGVRVIVMPHVTRSVIDAFTSDLESVVREHS